MSRICLKIAMVFMLSIILPFSSTLAYVIIKEHPVELSTELMQNNRKIVKLDSKHNLDINIGNTKNIQRTERSKGVNDVRGPNLLASSSYATFTSLTGNATTVQKGEAVSFQSLTEWLLVTKRPVQEGAIIYYDVNEVVGDEANYEGLISNYSQIAIEFEVSEPTTYAAFSLNLSNCVDLIQNYDMIFYLTDNLSAYQTDYLMQRELSHYTYQVHQGDADSPLMFVFYDHPFTIKNSDLLEANKPYYVVIDSPQPIEIQYSLDASEKDDNTLWVYENYNWIEKTGLDVQFSIFRGYNISEIAVDGVGETNFVFDTSNITGIEHRIVGSYYDENNLFAISSDFCDIKVIDLNAPTEISLVAPNTVQYTDDAELIATVKNLYATPIANASVMFYHSFDNRTWVFDAEETTDHNGVTVFYYNVNRSSGVVYFKAVSGNVVGFDATICEKEVAMVLAPEVVAIYGSKTGSATESYFQIFVQVKDDDGKPISNVLVSFNMAGQTVPYYSFTNATGWAETGQGVLDWDVGLYTSAYWVEASLDTNLYVNPGTTYGDIRIVPNTLELVDTSSTRIIWNEGGKIEKQFVDAEGDPIPNLNVRIFVLDPQSQNSTSLGVFITNSSGFVSFTIPDYMFEPRNYEIHLIPDSANYENYEGIIQLTVDPDKLQLTVLPSQADNYTYGSTLHLEIQVTDHLDTVLSNVGVWVYVSYANAPFAWEVYYYYYTNETGWVSLDLVLDRQAGDVFNILVATDDYAVNGVIYSTKADAVVLDYLCIAAPLTIEGLQDINTTNQAIATIEGYIMSNGDPVTNYSVEISILSTVYWVNTDSNGHFQLDYFVPQGGNIVVNIIANSTINYENVTNNLTIYAAPCEIAITTSDILYTGEGDLIFKVIVKSMLNTSLEGVEVSFWWYDGTTWNLLGSNLTDVEGNALFSMNNTLPLGDYKWKASVVPNESWLGGEAIKELQIGLHTTTTIELDAQTVEYKDTLTITVTVLDQNLNPVSIEVKIYLNEALIVTVTTNSSGIAIITWKASILPETYTISAQSSAWEYYQKSSASTNVRVTKAPSNLSTTGDIITYYNNSITIEAYLYTKDGALIGETIEISVDSNLVDNMITNSSGWAAWQVTNYDPGTYMVVLEFQGNLYYSGCNASITLRIEKIQTNLDVNAPNSDYTSAYEITGQVYGAYQQPLSGVTVELFINDSFAATTTTNQQGQFVFVQDLLPGDYKITTIVNATQFIENAEKINYVHIWKLQSNITGDVTTTATTINIIGNLTANSLPLEGLTVSIFINDSWVADVITDALGHFEHFIDNIIPAVYKVEIIYAGNQIYEGSSQTIVIEQNKLQTEMSISINHGVYGTQPAQLTIYLSSKQEALPNELLIIEYANKTYTILTNTSGYAVFLFDTFIDAGVYSVQVIFEGTIIYSSNTQFGTVQIYKATSQISGKIDYSNNTIMGTLVGLETLNNETITITINGSVDGTTITGPDGSFAYSLDLTPGNYEIKLLFGGNKNYLACENTLFVSIDKNMIIITAPNQIESTYGKEMTLNITVKTISGDPVVDNLTVIIDGASYGSIETNSTGVAVLVLPSLEPGNHNIIIEMQENEYYLYASHNVIITVKCELEISNVMVQAGNYGMEVNISGVIIGAVSSYNLVNLKATVNNETYTITIKSDGTWELILPAEFPAGTFDLELLIEDTCYVMSANYSITFTRRKAILDIELESTNRIFNDQRNLLGQVTFNGRPVENVSLEVYIDDSLVLKINTSKDGTFALPSSIFNLKPGNYVLKIIARSSDNNYAESVITNNLVIEKDAVKVTIETLSSIQAGSNSTFIVHVTGSNNNALEGYEISIFLEDQNLILCTNTTGDAMFDFIPLYAGNLMIVASANETEYYSELYYETQVLVERGEASIEISTTEFYYNASTGVTIILSAHEVTIAEANLTIVLEDLKTYFLLTDENGASKLYLWNIDAGIYNLRIQFEGTDDYLSSELNASITILPQPTRLQVEHKEDSVRFALLDSENRFIANQSVFVSIINENGTYIWNTTVLSSNNLRMVVIPVEFINQGSAIYLEYAGNNNFLSSVRTIELDSSSSVKQNPKTSNNSAIMIVLSIVGMVGLFGAGEIARKFVG